MKTCNCGTPSHGRARLFARAFALSLGALAIACGDDDPSVVPLSDGAVSDAGADGDAGNLPPDELDVVVAEGKLRGVMSKGARAFRGIPYAKPPVGALRFAPPEPAEAWSGTRDASKLGASCWQNQAGLGAPPPYNEDCLFLNVFSPLPDGAKHPVMVWIHGGAFVTGGSASPLYDAGHIAKDGSVVVVTLNYRLGALGLLSHPALDEVRAARPSGNDALRDQQLALRWVQRNIAAFGGDPDNITLYGESAGSVSTCLQMVSPTSRGIAKRYMLESGACTAGLDIVSKDVSNALGVRFAQSLCSGDPDTVACLRRLDPMAITQWGATEGISGAGWAPMYDAANEFLPKRPQELLASDDLPSFELLLGSNAREWSLFTFPALSLTPPITTLTLLEIATSLEFGPETGAAARAHYMTPPAEQPDKVFTDADASALWDRMMTDAAFRCPMRQLARSVSMRGNKVFLYSFDFGLAWHAFELPYVFAQPSAQLMADPLNPTLLQAMQSYWLQFARVGDPNVSGQPTWPRYTAETDQHITLKAASEVGSGLAQRDCDFWAQHPYP